MTVGPIVSGSLHATVGYYYMNMTYGESPSIIVLRISLPSFPAISLGLLAILSFYTLRSRISEPLEPPPDKTTRQISSVFATLLLTC